MNKLVRLIVFGALFTFLFSFSLVAKAEEQFPAKDHELRETKIELIDSSIKHSRFTFNSGLHFEYPDAVRGIYVTGHSAGGARFDTLVDLIDRTDLNTMVIDIKDDFGNITFPIEEGSTVAEIGRNYINDPKAMMKVLEEKQIYPIARIVVFKDTVLAEKRPDLSFTDKGKVWKNGRNEAFVNPFLKEVWDHNINIAKMAVELGFQDIQFDYVRFPEGFELRDEELVELVFDQGVYWLIQSWYIHVDHILTVHLEGFELRDEELVYDQGEYANSELNNIQRRVEAVTDFVKYARETLGQYGVDVSV